MSKPRFGQILDPDFNPTRDAVHVPIIPVVSKDLLAPGERLTLVQEGNSVVRKWCAYRWNRYVDDRTWIAVVDPFLEVNVKYGEMFYAFLRPESTQKLWHEWTNRELDK